MFYIMTTQLGNTQKSATEDVCVNPLARRTNNSILCLIFKALVCEKIGEIEQTAQYHV